MQTSPVNLLRVFPDGGREICRIDWFGDITHAGRRGGNTPMAKIVISQWHHDKKKKLTTKDRANRYTTITVPVAFLRMFRIGDLWRGGRQVGTDKNFVQETFANLEINDSTVGVAPAGFPLQPDGADPLYPLPFSVFKAHREHTGAFCARIIVTESVTLVVPCMELVRFYFGASGGLLKRLFSGPLIGKALYTSARINKQTGVARLDLAPNLPGVAASTVGRIAFDAKARKAMHWLVNSGVSATANGERHYARTTFPFEGITDLTAQGRWIDLQNHRIFLAETLIRCTHPFPFQMLFYTSHIDALTTRKVVQRKLDQQIQAAKAKFEASNSPPIGVAEGRVARDLQPAAIVVEQDNDSPFPDLVGKRIRRIKNDAYSFRRVATASPDLVLVAGEPSSSSDASEVEITTEPIENEVELAYPNGVELVQAICEQLRSDGSNYVQLAPLRESDDHDMPFTQASDLVSIKDSRLEGMWAARIITRAPKIKPSMLLLIQEYEPLGAESGKDQGLLIPYDPESDQAWQKLEKHIVFFGGYLAFRRDSPPRRAMRMDQNFKLGSPCDIDLIARYLAQIHEIGRIRYDGKALNGIHSK